MGETVNNISNNTDFWKRLNAQETKSTDKKETEGSIHTTNPTKVKTNEEWFSNNNQYDVTTFFDTEAAPVEQKGWLESLIENFNKKTQETKTVSKNTQAAKSDEIPDFTNMSDADRDKYIKNLMKEAGVPDVQKTSAQKEINAANITPATEKEAQKTIEDKRTNFEKMQEIQKKLQDPNLSSAERNKLTKEATELFSASQNQQVPQISGLNNITTNELKNAYNTLRTQAGVPSNVTGQENYKKLADEGKLKPVELEDPVLKKVAETAGAQN